MTARHVSANAGGATALIVCAALAGFPVRALAQDRPPTAPPAASQPSSMQVTQLEGGWLAAPDVKVTRVDDRAATLAGGYTGWVTDGAFLVGAGGYWLANGSADREMAYGGLVLEWFARTDKRIRFGVRTLVGGGRATIGLSYPDLLGPEASVALEDAPIRFGHRDLRGRRPGVDRGDLTNRRCASPRTS